MMKTAEREIAGKKIILKSGAAAKQAHGSVWVQTGETVVLVTAVSNYETSQYQGFMPLQVDYRERAYAAGKIPGGFFKRENKPYDHEVLRSRLIDRPIRPLFPKDYKQETQIFAFVVSFDQENDPDILGIIGASSALSISDIPFAGPIGAVKVGYKDGQYIINPTISEQDGSLLDIVIAGTGTDIIMVEGGGYEISEKILLDALKIAMPVLAQQVELQKEFANIIGKPKRQYLPSAPSPEIEKLIKETFGDRYEEIVRVPGKFERNTKRLKLVEELKKFFEEKFPDEIAFLTEISESIERECMRKLIVSENRRTDGRLPDEIRPISIEIGILPRAHGSALFSRGETQALAAVTLGTKLDEQKIEDLEGESYKSFILHYNFPSFSVGEAKPMRGITRREIGHGYLAERALSPTIPSDKIFPYTIRIVSDILESNGSSSMATVCAGSLALMDTGVPVKSAVAGIAMGLIKEGDKFIILSDIMGSEDHYGDMDFKVAGTENGITAFQMDAKIAGIPLTVLEQALEQAKQGRQFVLQKMNEVLPSPRAELSPHAPRVITLRIKPDKIGEIIGTGGKVVRGIQEQTGTTIAIEEDGTVFITSHTEEGMQSALKMIEDIVEEPEIGKIYEGTVTRITTFGAFVKITSKTEGLLHISEIANRRIERIEDVLKVGDKILVKVLAVEPETGKIKLSRKALLEK